LRSLSVERRSAVAAGVEAAVAVGAAVEEPPQERQPALELAAPGAAHVLAVTAGARPSSVHDNGDGKQVPRRGTAGRARRARRGAPRSVAGAPAVTSGIGHDRVGR
jgi:hypothetical protein